MNSAASPYKVAILLYIVLWHTTAAYSGETLLSVIGKEKPSPPSKQERKESQIVKTTKKHTVLNIP